ncbi:competence/damage-inducible protein A [Thermotoga profunda]|uniref:competence/damage-inducible protein A n=1 Tax=Thermotoga profunda TaxID=1508420 RepID=UPI000596F7FC|nr:competence/damage-inducible protein A [Thermotoga profunda]
MKSASIITIGSEIVEGIILNTNAKYLSEKLTQSGLKVKRHLSVDDNLDDIVEAIKLSMRDCDMIILSGGLGPTEDDKTREAVAIALGRKLVLNEKLRDSIKTRLSQYHKYIAANNDRQAMIIEGATIIPNKVGSAPGQLINHEGKILILLPGPPQELIPMFESVLVDLKIDKEFTTISMLFFAIAESTLDEMIVNLSPDPAIKIATQASYADGIRVRFTCAVQDYEKANELAAKLIDKIKDHFIGFGDTTLEQTVVKCLKEKNKTLSVAESCTGGMISSRIVSVPGASEVFLGGIVAYDNSVKSKLLKVSDEVLMKYGAVSEQCVVQMAHGIKQLTGSDLAISVSGIAGPSGGTDEKPVGTVFLCVVGDGVEKVTQLFYPQERNIFRMRVSAYGLYLVLKALNCVV